jgi:hypothetical protein
MEGCITLLDSPIGGFPLYLSKKGDIYSTSWSGLEISLYENTISISNGKMTIHSEYKGAEQFFDLVKRMRRI